MIKIKDKIVMRHTQIQGFICSHGTVFYCSKILENDNYEIMSGNDPIIININNISKVYDGITNELIFSHNPKTNL